MDYYTFQQCRIYVALSKVTKTRTSPGHLLAIIINIHVDTSVWVQRRIFHFSLHVRRDHLKKSLIIIIIII